MCLSVGLQQHGAMLPCFRLLVCLLMLLTSQAQSSKSSGTPSNEGLGEANKPAPSSTSPGVCEMYGLQPRQHQATQQVPRVIDCFLASNEVDMIEIRLRELEAGWCMTNHRVASVQCRGASACTRGMGQAVGDFPFEAAIDMAVQAMLRAVATICYAGLMHQWMMSASLALTVTIYTSTHVMDAAPCCSLLIGVNGSVVDKFVVLESRMSFRGSKRTLHYPRVINRLPAAVVQKVKYVVLDTLVGNDAWAMEAMQRNALFDHAEAQPGDILILSDCDEIPKPTFVAAFKQCQGLKFPLSMQAAHHYYSFGVASTNVDQVCGSMEGCRLSLLAQCQLAWQGPAGMWMRQTSAFPFSLSQQQWMSLMQALHAYQPHCAWQNNPSV